jgi:hypothetical protein
MRPPASTRPTTLEPDPSGSVDDRSVHRRWAPKVARVFYKLYDARFQHAYGYAIDINPAENPYVGPRGVSTPNGRRDVHREPLRRVMLAFHDRAWWAFHSIGWHWSWDLPTDYQHFSATDR